MEIGRILVGSGAQAIISSLLMPAPYTARRSCEWFQVRYAQGVVLSIAPDDSVLEVVLVAIAKNCGGVALGGADVVQK